MKTVFKVGHKVYDEVNFPGKEGVIINTNKNNKLNLLVKFDSVNYLYTLKGIYLGCNGTPTLSTKPYKVEFQGFEQKAPVRTYEEVIKEARSKGDYYYLPDSLEAPSEELVDATIALLKLLFLRDYYNEEWQPDWKNDYENKYVILVENDKIECEKNYSYKRVLAFKTSEIRDKFLEDQRELLEIAKPLL